MDIGFLKAVIAALPCPTCAGSGETKTSPRGTYKTCQTCFGYGEHPCALVLLGLPVAGTDADRARMLKHLEKLRDFHDNDKPEKFQRAVREFWAAFPRSKKRGKP